VHIPRFIYPEEKKDEEKDTFSLSLSLFPSYLLIRIVFVFVVHHRHQQWSDRVGEEREKEEAYND